MKKKTLSLLLSAVLLLSLSLPALAAENATPVSIVFWHSMSDTAGTLIDKFVKEFNETLGMEKGITVEAVFQGQYSDATTKLNSILSAESYADLPDVMNLDATGKVAYYSSGAAYLLESALKDDPSYDISQILDIALANWTFAGAQLGMPFAASTSIMFYNKTLLDTAGAEAPQTFSDIIALNEKLPKTTADNTPLATFSVVPNTPSLANWIGQLGSDVVDKENGSEAMAENLDCVENGALETFLTEWKAMYDAGALVNAPGSSDMFVAGQLALYPASSSNISSLLGKIGESFELGVTYYPKVNEAASMGATVSGSCLVMFDKQDEQKKAASWEFVKYLASAQVQAEFAANTGYIPVNKGAADVPSYQELLAQYPQYGVPLSQLSLTPATMKSVTVGPAKDFYYAIQDNVAAMLDEGWAVDEAVEIISEELNGLLYQYKQANP